MQGFALPQRSGRVLSSDIRPSVLTIHAMPAELALFFAPVGRLGLGGFTDMGHPSSTVRSFPLPGKEHNNRDVIELS